MAVQDEATLADLINSTVQDNTAEDISASEVRIILHNAIESLAFRTAITAAAIKALYEGNADVNQFTDALLTKLNAIAAGAQVNPTAAAILTSLLTVDGANSGLDADLLDGMTPAEVAALAAGGQTDAQINTLIQTALAAAVTGNTETGIAVTHNADGTLDFVVGATPAPTHASYVGVGDDTTWTAAEALAGTPGMGNALATPSYSGAMHVAFYRPASEGDFTSVYIYESGMPNTQNQISAWTQAPGTVDVAGEDHNVLYSTAALTGAGGFIVEVA